MTFQEVAVLLLAGLVVSAVFGGPCAALLGLWLIRRSARRTLPVPRERGVP